ncbi:hypothetical protein NEOLI_005324 [Neolecta irregularis DAH-3]|uniref:Uncharacterized protein n=1 Tax=Neolecta irregularis (strain DAH-3) TaxID=1198029 RepID=A0A1U7LQ38_NEOID|nr:hypothetical protein NEOLI_005324 [Neolecta irregularis DAH-3]|eukprot:OLL24662.1 hypothetical protein NEOLI_005324 [Neolecta irregularis DAH-3]
MPSDAQKHEKETLKPQTQPSQPAVSIQQTLPQAHLPSPATLKQMQQPHPDQKAPQHNQPQQQQQQQQQQAYRYPPHSSHLQAKPEQQYELFSHTAQYHQGMPFGHQHYSGFGNPSYYDQRSMGYLMPDA